MLFQSANCNAANPLLLSKANINHQDSEGNIQLHIAYTYGNVNIIELIRKKMNLSIEI